jgi:hypothetical protein
VLALYGPLSPPKAKEDVLSAPTADIPPLEAFTSVISVQFVPFQDSTAVGLEDPS